MLGVHESSSQRAIRAAAYGFATPPRAKLFGMGGLVCLSGKGSAELAQ